jgi:hypothetical protein
MQAYHNGPLVATELKGRKSLNQGTSTGMKPIPVISNQMVASILALVFQDEVRGTFQRTRLGTYLRIELFGIQIVNSQCRGAPNCPWRCEQLALVQALGYLVERATTAEFSLTI